jgi:hypothetical protein
LTAVAALMATGASAQDCPAWLNWACSGGASSTAAAREGARQERQRPRTKPISHSAMNRRSTQSRTAASDNVTNPKSQQTQAPKLARSAKVASGDPASDLRLVRHEDRQGSAMTEQEKEELFEQFVEWQNARRLNAETNR